MAGYGDGSAGSIPVVIEAYRGLLVAALCAGSREVFVIGLLVAVRCRGRRSVSRGKSDPGVAVVVANLRTDMHVHRLLPADSELARAVSGLARAQ